MKLVAKKKTVVFGGDRLSRLHIRLDFSRFLEEAKKNDRKGALKMDGVIVMAGRIQSSRFFMHWSVVAARLPQLWARIKDEASPDKPAGLCLMIALQGVNTTVFKALREYVYLGHLCREATFFSERNAQNLLNVAKLFGVAGLAHLMTHKLKISPIEKPRRLVVGRPLSNDGSEHQPLSDAMDVEKLPPGGGGGGGGGSGGGGAGTKRKGSPRSLPRVTPKQRQQQQQQPTLCSPPTHLCRKPKVVRRKYVVTRSPTPPRSTASTARS